LAAGTVLGCPYVHKKRLSAEKRIGEKGLRQDQRDVPLRLIVADSYLAIRELETVLRHAQTLIKTDPEDIAGFH
jgi:hypothetical protein